ncbi:MAG: GNAT family N-acetyltransferase [Proteobacteria bacterium]|nr:GNAT family N-acetyltransferase [Pseudomonadota bacterium]
MEVHVTEVPWSSHSEKLQDIRRRVFIVEQNVPKEIEWDGEDEGSRHFLAVNELGLAVGCARLLASGQIGRMAVLAEFRGTGIGFKLLNLAVETAKLSGFEKVFLHAQTHARAFYSRAGFLVEGYEFEEAGIPHINMEMILPLPFDGTIGPVEFEVREALPIDDTPPYELHHFDGEQACIESLKTTVDLPRRSLRIYSPTLDHLLFDNTDVVNAISAFVRNSRHTEVRVLISDPHPMVTRAHRLVELARRMDDKISIRCLPKEVSPADENMLVWDASGFWIAPDYREYIAYANYYDPVTARRHTDRFDHQWQRSVECAELRVLRL